jgi:thiamine kinase-like enzyme
MFDDKFIATLSEDNTEAAGQVCKKFFEVHNSLGSAKKQKANFELYLKAMAFAEIFIDSRKINYGPIPTIEPAIENAEENIIKRTYDFFSDWQKECEKKLHARSVETAFIEAREKYAAMLGRSVVYEFSDEEYNKIRDTLKVITEQLSNSDAFNKEYKTRLLSKFQKLQDKLSPKMSHFDGLWGMIIDIWIALGKSHSAAKPLAQEAQEIANIIWGVQSDTENIKKISPVQLLPKAKIAAT